MRPTPGDEDLDRLIRDLGLEVDGRFDHLRAKEELERAHAAVLRRIGLSRFSASVSALGCAASLFLIQFAPWTMIGYFWVVIAAAGMTFGLLSLGSANGEEKAVRRAFRTDLSSLRIIVLYSSLSELLSNRLSEIERGRHGEGDEWKKGIPPWTN